MSLKVLLQTHKILKESSNHHCGLFLYFFMRRYVYAGKSEAELYGISEADVENDMEYIRYAVEIERTIHRSHGEIAGCDDPKKVAMSVMETISRFYDADWCGIIHIDWMSVYGLRYGGTTQRTDRWHRMLARNLNYRIIADDGWNA